MLDVLFAIAQFLCLIGLLFALVLVLTRRQRAKRISPEELLSSQHVTPLPGREASGEGAALEKPIATMRVVPIQSSRLSKSRKAGGAQKNPREPRKTSRRRAAPAATDEDGRAERAVLLMKHARKPPESDSPRLV